MQKVSFRKVKTSVYLVKQDEDEEIMHFALEELLPAGHTLALNATLGTLALLANEPGSAYPSLLVEQQFTGSELSVLVPLLRSYPHYCPYEVLLASFNCGKVTEAMIDRYRERLQEAQQAGVWDYEMRPVRNVLSRTRLKLRAFSIEVSSILETGYVLMYLPRRKHREE